MPNNVSITDLFQNYLIRILKRTRRKCARKISFSSQKASLKQSLILLALLVLSSCSSAPYINLHTRYLNKKTMASYHVGTPDPNLNDPPTGEQLIIMWANLPKEYFEYKLLCFKITIRFCNQEETTESLPIYCSYGTQTYTTFNEDYARTGGILTYKAELCSDAGVLYSWQHQLWTNKLDFSHNTKYQK